VRLQAKMLPQRLQPVARYDPMLDRSGMAGENGRRSRDQCRSALGFALSPAAPCPVAQLVQHVTLLCEAAVPARYPGGWPTMPNARYQISHRRFPCHSVRYQSVC
jgi:hypothetical protein